MIAGGLRAQITCIDPRVLPSALAGREYNREFLATLPGGVDPCGENGEFPSFAFDGPMFRRPVALLWEKPSRVLDHLYQSLTCEELRMLQKLAEFIQPSRRAPRECEACGRPFVCGASLTGCWCFDIKLSAATRKELRAQYKDCLCRECLETNAQQSEKSFQQ